MNIVTAKHIFMIILMLTAFSTPINSLEKEKQSLPEEACARAYIFKLNDFVNDNTSVNSPEAFQYRIENGKLFVETIGFWEYRIYSAVGTLFSKGSITSAGFDIPATGELYLIQLIGKNNNQTFKINRK